MAHKYEDIIQEKHLPAETMVIDCISRHFLNILDRLVKKVNSLGQHFCKDSMVGDHHLNITVATWWVSAGAYYIDVLQEW